MSVTTRPPRPDRSRIGGFTSVILDPGRAACPPEAGPPRGTCEPASGMLAPSETAPPPSPSVPERRPTSGFITPAWWPSQATTPQQTARTAAAWEGRRAAAGCETASTDRDGEPICLTLYGIPRGDAGTPAGAWPQAPRWQAFRPGAFWGISRCRYGGMPPAGGVAAPIGRRHVVIYNRTHWGERFHRLFMQRGKRRLDRRVKWE